MKLSIDCPKSGYDKVEDIDLASWNDLIEINKSHLENIESEAKQLIKDKMDKFSGYIPLVPISMGKDSMVTCHLVTPKGYSYLRYDEHVDNMTDDEYCDFTERLFLEFDRVLNLGGVVLYNLSYGNNNRDGMYKAINTIITNTPFTIADVICWKKKTALPNNCSPNKLTRIWESVFVFCRKTDIDIFYCNKPVVAERKTGQKSYGNIFNYIEAKNNDGPCPLNKATYSTDLCKQLLRIYANPEDKDFVVYDPFMGTGTTLVACKEMDINCFGCEISKKQCEWTQNRLTNQD